MALGPGKYDDLCTYVREQAGAVFTLVAIFGGKRGDGFSVQFVKPADRVPGYEGNAIGIDEAQLMMEHAAVLRDVANQMQTQARKLRQKERGE